MLIGDYEMIFENMYSLKFVIKIGLQLYNGERGEKYRKKKAEQLTCLAQIIEPATGGRSLTLLIRQALLCGYWTLNFSCKATMSSLTRWISWVWYSRIAPLIWGRTNKALKREKILNISLAFLAVPSWSLNLAVILVSTLSILSSYLC